MSKKSTKAMWTLCRDNRTNVITRAASENALWTWMHSRFPYSISHALDHEGYIVVPPDGSTYDYGQHFRDKLAGRF